MTGLHRLVAAALTVATLVAGAATVTRVGAQDVEHPEGLSLKDESVRTKHRGLFFLMYAGRSHRGGGLHSGK